MTKAKWSCFFFPFVFIFSFFSFPEGSWFLDILGRLFCFWIIHVPPCFLQAVLVLHDWASQDLNGSKGCLVLPLPHSPFSFFFQAEPLQLLELWSSAEGDFFLSSLSLWNSFQCLETFLVIAPGEMWGNATAGDAAKHLQDTGQYLTTKNYPAQNVRIAKVEKRCSTDRGALLKVFLSIPFCNLHGSIALISISDLSPACFHLLLLRGNGNAHSPYSAYDHTLPASSQFTFKIYCFTASLLSFFFLISLDVSQILHILCFWSCSDPIQAQHSSSLVAAANEGSHYLWAGVGQSIMTNHL